MNTNQQKAFEALLAVKKACEENNIKYYLLAGTVLGAVRHKGFIPWDDDVDLGLTYSDYSAFEKVINDYLEEGFIYVSDTTNPSFPRMHGKILYEERSVLDVFLLVKMSDCKLVSKIQFASLRIIRKLYSKKCHYSGPTENYVSLFNFLSKFISKKKLMRLKEFYIKLVEKKEVRNYCNVLSVYDQKKETIPATLLNPEKEIVFQDVKFQSVNNFDVYLTNLYGDYTQLPPVEKRVPGHEEFFEGFNKKGDFSA